MSLLILVAALLLIRWIGVQLAITAIILRIEKPCQGVR